MIKGMVEHDWELMNESYWVRMKDLGVGMVRVDMSWWFIEPTAGTYNWSRCDAILSHAKRYGIQVLGLLGTSPSWVNGGHPCGAEQGYWFTPNNIIYFANYVEQIVGRYKDYVKYWEIWNEPNSAGFWPNSKIDGDDALGYMQLLRLGYIAAKLTDPDCKIVSAGLVDFGFKRVKNVWPIGDKLVNQLGYIHDMYSQGLKDYCDIFAIHPYFGDVNPNDRRWYLVNGLPVRWALEDGIKAVRKVMESNGDTKPMWITEIGWQVNSKVSEQKQADYLKSTYELCNKLPYLQSIFWYELQDAGNKPTDWKYGICKSDGSPKLAYNTYKETK